MTDGPGACANQRETFDRTRAATVKHEERRVDASTRRDPNLESGVEQVADQIWRIPLPLPLPDLQVVNAYAIADTCGITLIDPGWANEPSEASLTAGLARLGAEIGDVRRILVTHQHWDHFSLAVKLRQRFGMELLLGREEHHSIDAFSPLDGVYPAHAELLVAAGALSLADEVRSLTWADHELGIDHLPPGRWLTDGEEIDCGAVTLKALFTPGHTRGHTVFVAETPGVVFTGDHLLPWITPSIGIERSPEKLPLRSFQHSLRLFLDLPDARMLPAHGPTGGSTRSRAMELLDHHRRRLDDVAHHVSQGALTSFEVASRMRWTRHDRKISALSIIHRMTAVLEVKYHADLLVSQQILSKTTSAGVDELRVL